MPLKPDDVLEQFTQLIHNCINGDRNAQRRMYEILVPKMFAVCMRYARSRPEAEEILQEGFVQVFRSLKNFKFAGSFEGWVRKIMIHTAVAHFRNNSKMFSVISIETISQDKIGSEKIIDVLGKKELLKMVQALPPTYRMVFNLYVFEGMKHREIALALGISEGTSKSNLFDAKRILQRAVMNSMKVVTQKYSIG